MTRVLLVDDHVAIRHAVRMLMERNKIKVVGEFRDGDLALNAVGPLKPDVIVMDVVLCIRDGFKVLKALKKMAAGPKVVVFSAHHSETLAETVLAEGASAFVHKDFAYEQLLDAVRNAINDRGRK